MITTNSESKKSNPTTFLPLLGNKKRFIFKKVSIPVPLNTPHSTMSPGKSFTWSTNNVLAINFPNTLVSELKINPLKMAAFMVRNRCTLQMYGRNVR